MLEGRQESHTFHSCHGAPQAHWAPGSWLPASHSAEPGDQCVAASWQSVHLSRPGRRQSKQRSRGEETAKEAQYPCHRKGKWDRNWIQCLAGQTDICASNERETPLSTEEISRQAKLSPGLPKHSVRYLPFSVRSLRLSDSSSSSSSLWLLSSASCFFRRLIWNCGVCSMSPIGEDGEPERKLRKEEMADTRVKV